MKASRLTAAGGLMIAAAVALSGCAPAGAGEGAGDGAAEESNEITLWYISDAEEIVAAAVERFEADNPDITVNAVGYANDELKTKVAVGFGTPSGPDVFHTWGGGEFETFVDAGQVANLDEFAAEQGFDTSIGAGALGAGQVDGEQYAIPAIFDASMVWYNTEIFAELGLTTPTTWEEFLDVITAVKDAGLVPIAMANRAQWPGSHWWSEIVALACGPEAVPAIAAGTGDFSDPCFVEAGERIQELVNAGAFNEGFNGLDYDSGESRQLFWSGQAAMNHMGNWTISAAESEAPEMLEKMDFFTVPAWEGAAGTGDMMTGGVGMMWAAASDNRNLEASTSLIAYLSDAETGQVIADAGRVPAISGPTISNPLTARVAEAIAAAPAISLWPDQFLAPEVSQAMLVQVQALFGLETTPEDAAAVLQQTLESVRG